MMMNHHVQDSEQYKLQLSNAEENDVDIFDIGSNNFEDGIGELEDDEVDGDGNYGRANEEIHPETTVSSVKKLFQGEDTLFNSTYESLKNKMCEAFQTDTIERFVKEMAEKPYVRYMKDHLGRSFLHLAVEELNINFVECLLHVGFNPNAKQKCGITPLIISVIKKNKEICQLLVNSRASVRGPLFTNVPSPLTVAKRMELDEILEILDPTSSDEEDSELSFYDPAFHLAHSKVDVHTTRDNGQDHLLVLSQVLLEMWEHAKPIVVSCPDLVVMNGLALYLGICIQRATWQRHASKSKVREAFIIWCAKC